MTFTVIIPARLDATRLPRKPLLDIEGLPMIERVRRQAVASGARRVIVATDAAEIVACIQKHGGEALLTAATHRSGTDRLAELVERLRIDPQEIVVNLQGDEPLMPPRLIAALADALARQPRTSMATVACPIDDWQQLFNPNVVKVVPDARDFALYFSRAPLPWDRERFAQWPPAMPSGPLPQARWWRHVGLYAFRAALLPRFAAWPADPLELAESLEQLRALAQGERIYVLKSGLAPPPGVDTPADLEAVRTLVRDSA